MYFPTERYITPNRGIGYALGIIGGSMMLLLLLYSARKRFRWLKFLGPTVGWFRFHMVLGVLGPLCILYHSNFGLGATNSNVALFSMLTVAGSGLIGRYIYSRIHHGLYGSKATLSELRAGPKTFELIPAPSLSCRIWWQRLEASRAAPSQDEPQVSRCWEFRKLFSRRRCIRSKPAGNYAVTSGPVCGLPRSDSTQ